MAKRVTAADVVERLQGRPIELIEYAGSVVKQSLFRCLVAGCGHEWRGTADNITRGRSCPKCSGHIPVTEGDVLSRIEGRGITLVSYAGNTSDPSSTFKCDIDGHVWSTTASSVMAGSGCQVCGKMVRAIKEDAAHARLDGKTFQMTEYAGTAMGQSKFRCLVPGCGHEWSTSLRIIHGEGTGCKKCAGLLKLTADEAKARLTGRTIELVEYAGTTAGLSKFRCLIDGHEWSTTFTSVHNNGQGCQKCAGNVQITHEEALRRIQGKDVELVRYAGMVSENSDFRCTVDGCGHEWSAPVRAVEISKFNGCQKCAGTLQVTEDEARVRILPFNIEMLTYGGSSGGMSKFKCLDSACGYEWETSLSSVTNTKSGCQKCAGNLPVTADMVNERIQGRPVELVEYAGSVMKHSKWRCLVDGCGTEWEAPSDRVTGLQSSGCPSCAKSGFDPSKTGFVYVYKISTRNDEYLGFGITNKPKQRGQQHKSSFKTHGASAELLFSIEMQGVDAQRRESVLKSVLPITDTGIPGFRTEATLYSEETLTVVRAIVDGVSSLTEEDKTHLTI